MKTERFEGSISFKNSLSLLRTHGFSVEEVYREVSKLGIGVKDDFEVFW